MATHDLHTNGNCAFCGSMRCPIEKTTPLRHQNTTGFGRVPTTQTRNTEFDNLARLAKYNFSCFGRSGTSCSVVRSIDRCHASAPIWFSVYGALIGLESSDRFRLGQALGNHSSTADPKTTCSVVEMKIGNEL